MSILESLKPRLHAATKVAKSFLPWNGFKKRAPRSALQIETNRQWTPYSCTAAVAQMVVQFHGFKLNHSKAIKITDCRPDGATLESVADALKLEYGLPFKKLTKASQVRDAIKRGEPVMSNDALTYANNHAILVVGQTAKGFWIADPVTAEIYWRHEKQFMDAAGEFIAVSGKK